MRAITALQIESARMANPLTGLPGNLLINEQIDRLLEGRRPFVACYFDLDYFKPFNDLFGYAKGDRAIGQLAAILIKHGDPAQDFVGHLGGDDFIVLFGSHDWEARCRAILDAFAAAANRLFPEEVIQKGEYVAENREGQLVRIPLLTLSIGGMKVTPGRYASHVSLAAAVAAAKRKAKKHAGNSLVVTD